MFLIAVLPLLTILACQPMGADAKRNGIRRIDWCQWSRWSYCSPTPCHNRTLRKDDPTYTRHQLSNNDDKSADATVDSQSYCVDPLFEDDSRPEKRRTVVVRFWKDGIEHTRYPMKMRVRICHCSFFNILNVFGNIVQDRCTKGSREIECTRCDVNEAVHTHEDGNAPLLPLCQSKTRSATPLYTIFGAIAGAVVGLLFLIWLVRTLMLTRPTCNRGEAGNRGAHPRPIGPRNRADRDQNLELRLNPPDIDTRRCSNDNRFSELPPDYKDVIAVLPPNASRNIHPNTPLLPPNRHPSRSSTSSSPSTPPPDYDTIIHNGAALHLHSSATSVEGGGGGGGGGGSAASPDVAETRVGGSTSPSGGNTRRASTDTEGGGGGGGGQGASAVEMDVVFAIP